MVPGITERERLAVEQRRLEWLADARFGPAQLRPASVRRDPAPERRHAFLASLKSAISTAAIGVLQRICPAQFEPVKRASRNAAAPVR